MKIAINTLLLTLVMFFTVPVSATDLTVEEGVILHKWLTQPDKRAEAEAEYWAMVTIDMRVLNSELPVRITPTLTFNRAAYDGDRIITYSFTSTVPYPDLDVLKAQMTAANCADEQGALLITIFQGALIFEHNLAESPELPPRSYSITSADCNGV